MPQTSMLTVPGSMPTTRGIDSRLLRHQLPRDVGDRLGVQHEVVALEQACDARLVQLRLEVADGERAEAYDALLRDAVIRRLDAFDAERRDRVHVGHDLEPGHVRPGPFGNEHHARRPGVEQQRDRKSTRLNSSHLGTSYAGFCLKKKKS